MADAVAALGAGAAQKTMVVHFDELIHDIDVWLGKLVGVRRALSGTVPGFLGYFSYRIHSGMNFRLCSLIGVARLQRAFAATIGSLADASV